MKIRFTCKADEKENIINNVSKIYEIVEISDFYPNRGQSKLGRIYLDVENKKDVAMSYSDLAVISNVDNGTLKLLYEMLQDAQQSSRFLDDLINAVELEIEGRENN